MWCKRSGDERRGLRKGQGGKKVVRKKIKFILSFDWRQGSEGGGEGEDGGVVEGGKGTRGKR